MWPRPFRQGYCQSFNCPPEAFETSVFWRCLHRRAFPLSALMYYLNRDFFASDFQTIRQLGVAISFEEFAAEVDSFRNDNRRHGGFLRRNLRIRVSGRRLMELVFDLPEDMPVARRTRPNTPAQS
jgi:hypothetical protein